MRVFVQQAVSPIKGGWAAHGLGLAAHGRDPQIASANLERTLLRFFTPFERAGTLEREVGLLGLETDSSVQVLEVSLIDA